MNKILFAVLFLMTACLMSAQAQIKDGQYSAMTEPVDRAVGQHNAMYRYVPEPGADEDVKPQDVRYNQMTVPVNEAMDRHLEVSHSVNTIIEQEAGK
jgi:ABC-type transporter MlaC component